MKEVIKTIFNDRHYIRKVSIAELSAVGMAWSAVSIIVYEFLSYIF